MDLKNGSIEDLLENRLNEHLDTVFKTKELLPLILQISEKILARIKKGGTLFFMGNGGSAADAQHLAAELIGRFSHEFGERKPIPAIALTTDTSVLTCLANDYHYENVFVRQVEALCNANGVVIGLSTSGNSINVIKGIEAANKKGALTIALTGLSGGKLAGIVDHCIKIPSTTTARIQEMHIFIGHMLCELIERFVAEEQIQEVEVV